MLQIPNEKKGTNELYLFVLIPAVTVFLLWFGIYKQSKKKKNLKL